MSARPPVVDTQVHVWREESPTSPWEPAWREYAHRGGVSPTYDELVGAMADAGVDHALLVAPTFGGDAANNEVVLELARRDPGRFSAIGRVDLRAGGPDDVRRWVDQPGAAGLRLTFGRASAGWLTDGTADWFWPVAAETGVRVLVSCPGHVEDLVPVLREHPTLHLALDHAGLPPGTTARDVPPLLDATLALASLPHLSVKASALPSFTGEAFPYPSAQRWARDLVAAYGADRVFWGTDLTRGLPGTWAESATYLAQPGGLTGADLDLVMGRAVLAWLGAPAPTTGGHL